MGENDKIAENNNLVLNNFLKYNRQAIGWVIINRYYEEKHRRSLGVGRQFIDSNSTLSYYSVITKGDGDAFHALNGNISKGVMESNNEAYQQAFWMASYARVCNTLTQINSVAPRPTGVTWQCYNKGRLHIDTSPGYNWQRVIFPGSSVDYSGASNYSGFEYYSCIDKFNLVFCYKPGNQGGEDLFIGEIYRLELGIE